MGMIEELTALGKEIDAAKKNVATLEGRKSETLDRLLSEYNQKDIKGAEALLAKMEAEVVALDASISADFADLKSKFTW